MQIRQARLSSQPGLPSWGSRASYAAIFTDVLHQLVKKHGRNVPHRRRISISLSRKAALVLRSAAVKVGINETDILNTAIREYDEKQRNEDLKEFASKLGVQGMIGEEAPKPANSSTPISKEW